MRYRAMVLTLEANLLEINEQRTQILWSRPFNI